jgi:hypothetical protein
MKPFAYTYVRLLAAGVGTAVLLGVLGYFPTLRIAGPSGIPAMVAGIVISLTAACLGAIPVGLAGGGDPRKAGQAILAATALRFLVAVGLTVPAVFSDWFDRAPLGLWVGISYLVMLAVDTTYAVRVVGKAEGDHA